MQGANKKLNKSCSNCLIVFSEKRSDHYCNDEDLKNMNELRHAQTQLRMSENQPLRQEFFKNKIHLIEQKIKEASKN